MIKESSETLDYEPVLVSSTSDEEDPEDKTAYQIKEVRNPETSSNEDNTALSKYEHMERTIRRYGRKSIACPSCRNAAIHDMNTIERVFKYNLCTWLEKKDDYYRLYDKIIRAFDAIPYMEQSRWNFYLDLEDVMAET